MANLHQDDWQLFWHSSQVIASHCAGNLEKSFAESSNMLPFVVAADHCNYIYLPPLNGVPSDMVLEQTYSIDMKESVRT